MAEMIVSAAFPHYRGADIRRRRVHDRIAAETAELFERHRS
ncbi:hypothetical protein QE377_002198 [Microbacterium sp. SORGH_AS 862]|nr:hypothetical protein [Microbacterium sp. SORGH_AS_0862]